MFDEWKYLREDGYSRDIARGECLGLYSENDPTEEEEGGGAGGSWLLHWRLESTYNILDGMEDNIFHLWRGK